MGRAVLGSRRWALAARRGLAGRGRSAAARVGRLIRGAPGEAESPPSVRYDDFDLVMRVGR